jgi:hypothetical protein
MRLAARRFGDFASPGNEKKSIEKMSAVKGVGFTSADARYEQTVTSIAGGAVYSSVFACSGRAKKRRRRAGAAGRRMLRSDESTTVLARLLA